MLGASHLVPVLSNFRNQFDRIQEKFINFEPSFLEIEADIAFPWKFKTASI
jgi:hypothetical protein